MELHWPSPPIMKQKPLWYTDQRLWHLTGSGPIFIHWWPYHRSPQHLYKNLPVQWGTHQCPWQWHYNVMWAWVGYPQSIHIPSHWAPTPPYWLPPLRVYHLLSYTTSWSRYTASAPLLHGLASSCHMSFVCHTRRCMEVTRWGTWGCHLPHTLYLLGS